MRLVRTSLACALVCALVPAPAAADGPERSLLREVNELRTRHGLAAVRASSTLARSSGAWADQLARDGVPRHGNVSRDRRRFRIVSEVVEWHRGDRPRAGAAVRRWMRSRSHRRVLLDPRLRWLGAGRAVRVSGGRETSFWVARLGRR